MRTILLCLCVLFSVYTVVVYDVTGGRSAEAPTPEARAGMRLWQENNCQSCHQFYGLGGYMGPDLTNVAARRDEQRLRTFIRYGTGRMPAHGMSDEELDQLIAFLRWVDASGDARVPDSAVHWSGTYMIEPR